MSNSRILCLPVALIQFGNSDNRAEIVRVTPFRLQHHHGRGRPAIEFDQEWLANAISPTRRLSLQTLARTLGVHCNTLRRHLQINGLAKRFSDITDAELDILVCHYKLGRPNAGLRFVLASLKSHGLNIQRECVRMSLQRIDPLGRIIRHQNAIRRRVYEAPRSNYVWHIDGHHKLIRWGFVIHGMIDGHCRTVRFFLLSHNYSHYITRLLAYEQAWTIAHQLCLIFFYVQSKPTECLGEFVVTAVVKMLMSPLG